MPETRNLKFLVLFLFILGACSKDGVSLIDRNFTDEINPGSNLRFIFDKDIAPDSVLGVWDSTEYVTFSPSIPGSFKWVGPRELIFAPSGVFGPGQQFSAKLKKAITRYTKLSLVGEKEFTFRTPYLRMESMLAHWVQDQETKESYAKVDMRFNYLLKAEYLLKNIRMELDQKPMKFELSSNNTDQSFSLRIIDLAKHEDDLSGKIFFASSMNLEQQAEKPEEVPIGFVLVSPYKIEILNVSTEHDGDEGKILIYTSQPLKSEELKSFIHLDPEVIFEIVQETDYLSLSSAGLEPKKSYTLSIDQGIRGVNGGKLKAAYSTHISFAELQPELSFMSDDGMFLAAKGNRVIEMNITAIPKIRVRISKIYQNNIMSAVYGYYTPHSYNDYDYYDGEYYEENSGYYGEVKGDVIYDEVIETRTLPGSKYKRKFRMDIRDKLGDYEGIYHLHISAEGDYWRSISKFISVSDIGIIAKHGKKSVHVFCNSIHNVQSLQGAEVRLFGKNNQLMAKGSTDKDGHVVLDVQHGELAGFLPGMITVKNGNDFNFLPLGRTEVNTSRFDVGGKLLNSSGLDCFLYPERDIYRPGETLNLAGILRDNQFKLTDDIPLKVVIRLPTGVIFKELRKTINTQGSFEINEKIPKSSPTGLYLVQVSTMNDVLLATERIMVEEFIPDRIKVETKLNQEYYSIGDRLSLQVRAVNFFGPPAKDRNIEAEIQVQRVPFNPKGYEAFTFDLFDLEGDLKQQVFNKITDEQGESEIEMQIPNEYNNQGKMNIKVFTTVFDENGRTVSKVNTADLFTQEFFTGIRTARYYGSVNSPFESEIVVLNKEGKPVNKTVEVQVLRYEYRTVLENAGAYYSYRSQRFPVIVSSKKLTINGKNSFTFRPSESGEHAIMIRVEGQHYYVSSKIWAYNSSYTYSTSFEVNQEGSIDVTSSKNEFEAGETARLLFKTPFDGKMLVTLEQEDVLNSFYIDVKNHSAELSIRMEDIHLPNVYVSATLFKSHKATDMPLTVAHGYVSVNVKKSSRKLNVAIKSVEKSRSGKTQTIKLKTDPDAYVSLSVVDEGILQITDFQTPDPYQAFYGKRALEVHSFDLYPYLFKEVTYFSSTAGDGLINAAKMLNPINSNRVELISYWSGLLKADRNGNVEYTVSIPQFSGKLRIMAVAHKDSKFGNSESSMVVSDPIVQSASVPRFLSINDTLNLSINLSNTTGNTAGVKTTLSVKGPLEIVGASSSTGEIAANSEGRLHFKIYAKKEVGEAEIHFVTSSMGEVFKLDYRLPVRPATPRLTYSKQGFTEARRAININTADFIPSTYSAEITLGRSPLVQVKRNLEYLVQYPYGCLEQTVSSAFPQIFLEYMDDIGDVTFRQKAGYHVKEALDKIKLYALYNGAFSSWPGHGKADWWATVYTTHFMLECKKAGYRVDNRMLKRSLNYLSSQLRDKKKVDYYYENALRRLAPKEVAYSLYVLSLANEPDKSSMNYYRMNPGDLSMESRYLLAASYYLSGDRDIFNKMIPANWDGEKAEQSTGGSYGSDLREKAIMLNALAEIDVNHAQIPQISRYIIQQINARHHINTQEAAWCFLGIGKIARASRSNANAEIFVDGKSYGKYDLSKPNTIQLPARVSELEITGIGGNIYYSLMYGGVGKGNMVQEKDNQIQVRRHLFDRYGRPVFSHAFSQNELIIVKLTISSGLYRSLQNLAIQDLIPAGFEIENTRLKDVPGMSWIKNPGHPDYTDIRDDRIIFFMDMRAASHDLYYAVRAVSKGQFIWAPVSAECMYDASISSVYGQLMVKVD